MIAKALPKLSEELAAMVNMPLEGVSVPFSVSVLLPTLNAPSVKARAPDVVMLWLPKETPPALFTVIFVIEGAAVKTASGSVNGDALAPKLNEAPAAVVIVPFIRETPPFMPSVWLLVASVPFVSVSAPPTVASLDNEAPEPLIFTLLNKGTLAPILLMFCIDEPVKKIVEVAGSRIELASTNKSPRIVIDALFASSKPAVRITEPDTSSASEPVFEKYNNFPSEIEMDLALAT